MFTNNLLFKLFFFNYVFGVNISFYHTILFISFLSIANSLPFFYSGFGARELVGVLIASIILIDIKVLIDFTLTIGLLNFLLGFIVLIFIKLISIKKYL